MRLHKNPFFILSALLITSAAASAAEPTLLSGKDIPAKLGLLYLDGGKPSEHLVKLVEAGHVPIMKIPASDFAKPDSMGLRLKKANPKAIIVVGIGAQSKEMKVDREPANVYADWAKSQEGKLRTLTKYKDKVDYLSFMPNMWEPKTPEQAEWYNRYIAYAAPKIAELGFRPVILQAGVGGLPIKPDILDAIIPALKTAKKLGGAWAYHAYTIDYTTDVQHESYYSLRYRKAYEHLKKVHPEVADLTVIAMEGGVDKEGNQEKDGYLARGSKAKFTHWLRWLDEEMGKDPQILGVCLFKIGDLNSWKSFDIDPVAPWLGNYLKAKSREKADR